MGKAAVGNGKANGGAIGGFGTLEFGRKANATADEMTKKTRGALRKVQVQARSRRIGCLGSRLCFTAPRILADYSPIRQEPFVFFSTIFGTF